MEQKRMRMTKQRVLEKKNNDAGYVITYILHTARTIIQSEYPSFTPEEQHCMIQDVGISIIYNPLYTLIIKDPLDKYNSDFLRNHLKTTIINTIQLLSYDVFKRNPGYLLTTNFNKHNSKLSSLINFYEDKRRLNLLLSLYSEEFTDIYMEFENELNF